jgi:hypothetical protein
VRREVLVGEPIERVIGVLVEVLEVLIAAQYRR